MLFVTYDGAIIQANYIEQRVVYIYFIGLFNIPNNPSSQRLLKAFN